jgi:hypothetical protein
VETLDGDAGDIGLRDKWKDACLEGISFLHRLPRLGKIYFLPYAPETILTFSKHFFLQRLPQIPHIRSLYIPKIAEHIHGNNIDSQELALQVVDIVTLRPEIEICYMGLGPKCFEVLENKPSTYDARAETGSPDISPGAIPGAYGGNDPLAMTDDETEDDDEDDMDGDGGAISGDETASELSDGHDTSDDESFTHDDERKTPRLRLREILFYDDKVAIFKARHGRL